MSKKTKKLAVSATKNKENSVPSSDGASAKNSFTPKDSDDKKEIRKSAVTLSAIVGICVLILAVTNHFTKDKIKAHADAITFQAQSRVINATSFETAQFTHNKVKSDYYIGKKGDSVAGYVFITETTGKNTGLKVMTGINIHGEVTGVEIVEESETPGYADTVRSSGIFKTFIGKTSERLTEVDTVSQATRTSQGLIDGVTLALSYYENYIKVKG